MDTLIATVSQGSALTAPDVQLAVKNLIDPAVDLEQKADFLRAWRKKGETASEIASLVEALLERALDPEIIPAELDGPLTDICGTGGDKLELFNISTTAMFILAACGVVVAKHGNRGITSKSGSADVLEALGIPVACSPETIRESLKRNRFAFIFAPHFHPAFKEIAPVRKKLAAEGVTTVFNLIGPILNPARPPFQLMGHFDSRMAGVSADVLVQLGRKKAWVVHGTGKEIPNGMDKVSTLGATDVHSVEGTLRKDFTVDARTLRPHAILEELQGTDALANAKTVLAILQGTERGPKRDIVLINAAAGLVVAQKAVDLKEALALASAAVDSGKAMAVLDKAR